jgi:hypothetical protein
MSWYVVYLLFAKPPKPENSTVKCESCQVLIKASDGHEAYKKSLDWAQKYVRESDFKFAGVEHLKNLYEEEITDGMEIGGSFFNEENFWERLDEFIPEKEKLSAILWETNAEVPLEELMTEEQKQNLMQVFEKE